MQAELHAAPNEKIVATSDLIPSYEAVEFPMLSVFPMASEDSAPPIALSSAVLKSRATLITLSFQALGQSQLKKWTVPYLEMLPQPPESIMTDVTESARQKSSAPAVLHVLYLDGYFFSLLKRFFILSTRKSLSASDLPHNALAFQSSDKETDVSHAMSLL